MPCPRASAVGSVDQDRLVPSPSIRMAASLGRYRVIAPLGEGGMAQILLARLTGAEGFERPVVIKRIRGEHTRDRDFVDMFLDEARLIAGIRHPNVVQVQDLGNEKGEL